MNWKIFTAASVSVLLLLSPLNMIGCGPDPDTYDYYTSFFHQQLPDADGYQSFYYTGLSFLYNDAEPINLEDSLAGEWAAYCGNGVTKKDAYSFVYQYSLKDVKNLYAAIDNKRSVLLDSLAHNNSMMAYFIKTDNMEALGYIIYAKKVEPNVVGDPNNWEAPDRDSLKMAALTKDGQQLYAAAKTDFIKLRYGYQIVRLAHYSGRPSAPIQFYDDYVAANKTASVLQNLSLSLKAGALFRDGKKPEAAYLFSQAFSQSIIRRVSNYKSFGWCINSDTPRTVYLNFCKNDQERANMLALFALSSTGNELDAMQQIYKTAPNADVLQVLAVREINKLEEKYFTPLLEMQKGGQGFFLDDIGNSDGDNYYDHDDDSTMLLAAKEITPLAQFLHTVAQNKKAKNRGLFETAAAYSAYLIKDYTNAEIYLAKAKKINLTDKVKDQWQLTRLLVTINEKPKIDAAFEEQLLPSIQWLETKMKTEVPINIPDSYDGPITQWKTIFRDLLSEVLAKKYHQQGDLYKEALAIGAADNFAGALNGLYYLRNKMDVGQVQKLYGLMTEDKPNQFESWLVKNNSLTPEIVADFSGTAYLRAYDYTNAITWFTKGANDERVTEDPFVDLLYDAPYDIATDSGFVTTKLAFAKEMQRLATDAVTNEKNDAKDYYKMATGIYNMTYYGHAWELVQYDRSGVDGYGIPTDATEFQKEYYGCYTACNYFLKAYNASIDRNFKARCIFMMAKCSQKIVKHPDRSKYGTLWSKYDLSDEDYYSLAKNNKYFPQLVKECRQTPFFKEAYTRCSYLKDFVNGK